MRALSILLLVDIWTLSKFCLLWIIPLQTFYWSSVECVSIFRTLGHRVCIHNRHYCSSETSFQSSWYWFARLVQPDVCGFFNCTHTCECVIDFLTLGEPVPAPALFFSTFFIGYSVPRSKRSLGTGNGSDVGAQLQGCSALLGWSRRAASRVQEWSIEKREKTPQKGMDLNAPLVVYEERNCPSGG